MSFMLMLACSLGCSALTMIASYNNYPGGYALKALHQTGKTCLIFFFFFVLQMLYYTIGSLEPNDILSQLSLQIIQQRKNWCTLIPSQQ
jgi:hypothetical protein